MRSRNPRPHHGPTYENEIRISDEDNHDPSQTMDADEHTARNQPDVHRLCVGLVQQEQDRMRQFLRGYQLPGWRLSFR